MLFRQLFDDGEGVVSGTVVHDDDLVIPAIGLIKDGSNGLFNILLRVVSGNDYRNLVHGVTHRAFWTGAKTRRSCASHARCHS